MLAYNFQKYFGLYFFQNREFGEYFCKMPPKKNIKRRGSQEMERMSTQVQALSLELEELICVPETQQSQQAAGLEEVVMGVEDPLQMSDTEQGDIVPETQQDLDSSDEDITDTQVAGGHTRARAKASQRQGRGNMYQKADKRVKKATVLRMRRN